MTSGRFNCSSSEYSACVQTKHVALKSDKNVFLYSFKLTQSLSIVVTVSSSFLFCLIHFFFFDCDTVACSTKRDEQTQSFRVGLELTKPNNSSLV